jgi:hypothetical protein
MTCIESLAQICRIRAGRACPLSRVFQTSTLFRDSKRIIDLDAKISDGAFDPLCDRVEAARHTQTDRFTAIGQAITSCAREAVTDSRGIIEFSTSPRMCPIRARPHRCRTVQIYHTRADRHPGSLAIDNEIA